MEWLRQGLGAAVVTALLTRRFEELVCWPGAQLPEPAPVLELFLVTPKTLRGLLTWCGGRWSEASVLRAEWFFVTVKMEFYENDVKSLSMRVGVAMNRGRAQGSSLR